MTKTTWTLGRSAFDALLARLDADRERALRLRVHRLKGTLEECIFRCLDKGMVFSPSKHFSPRAH